MSYINRDENIYFKIIYKPKKNEKLKILGKNFIEYNKHNGSIIYNDKEYNLKEYLEEIDNNYNCQDSIEIKLKLNKNITDVSYMFHECNLLLSFSQILLLDNSNSETDSFFSNNSLTNPNFNDIAGRTEDSGQFTQTEISSITIKNTIDFTDKSDEFYQEKFQELLPILRLNNLSNIFYGCNSLISLPDIGKWNIENVTDMSCIFQGCKSLLFLPDISLWNTSKTTKMNSMFHGCNSLLSLPDISKWNTSNVIYMGEMFFECNSIISLPDISEWDISKVIDISSFFYGCNSLRLLPDLSKWKNNKFKFMIYMFYGCGAITFLPDKIIGFILYLNGILKM